MDIYILKSSKSRLRRILCMLHTKTRMLLFLFQFVTCNQICSIGSPSIQQNITNITAPINISNCSIVENLVINVSQEFSQALFNINETSSILFRNVQINNLSSSSQYVLLSNQNLDVYFSNVGMFDLKLTSMQVPITLLNAKTFTGSYVYLNSTVSSSTTTTQQDLTYFNASSIIINNMYLQMNPQSVKTLNITNQSNYSQINSFQLEFTGKPAQNITFAWGDSQKDISLGNLLVNWTTLEASSGGSNQNNTSYLDIFCPLSQIFPGSGGCYGINRDKTNYSFFCQNYNKYFINFTLNGQNRMISKIFIRENNFQRVAPSQTVINPQNSTPNNQILQSFCYGPQKCVCGTGSSELNYCACADNQLEYQGQCITVTTDNFGNECAGNRSQNCRKCGQGFNIVPYVNLQSVYNHTVNNTTAEYKEPHLYNKCVRQCGSGCLNKQRDYTQDCICQCEPNIALDDLTNNCTQGCVNGYEFNNETRKCYRQCENCFKGSGYIVGSNVFYKSCARGYTLKNNICIPNITLNQVATIVSAVIIIISIIAATVISVSYWIYTRKLNKERLYR